MVSKAKLAKLDISAAFDAVNKTLETEARTLTKDDFDQILMGKEVAGYVFAGKALSKKILNRDVGLVLVKDIEADKELWLGVEETHKDQVFSAKRLSALEWKISLSLSGES